MSATTGRRAVAACLSMFLALGLIGWTASPSIADDPSHPGQSYLSGDISEPNIEVRYYKATDTDPVTWELQTLLKSNSTYPIGQFGAWVPDGTYRVTFNELDDGTSNWDVWSPLKWSSDFEPDGTPVEVYQTYSLGSRYLNPRGGNLTGSVDDLCYGKPFGVNLEAYAAGDSDPAHSKKWFGGWGAYQGNAFAGPTKFRAVSDLHVPQWIGGNSFASATSYTIAPGDSETGPDLVVTRDFNAATNGKIKGLVKSPFYPSGGVAGLTVRFYHSDTNTDAGPWTLAGQTTTSAGGSGLSKGQYEKTLPEGVYRVTVNEVEESSVVSKKWAPTAFEGTNLATAANVCVDSAADGGVEDIELSYAGGTITGTVTDPRGKTISGTVITLYDGNDGSGLSSEVIHTTTSNFYGEYSIPSIAGPVKLRFAPVKVNPAGIEVDHHLPQWSGGAIDFQSASTVTANKGDQTTLNATLKDAQTNVLARARITGNPKIGSTLAAILKTGYDYEPGFTKTYQWFRTKGRTTAPIAGATHEGYNPTAADLGARLSVRVTITPPTPSPGVVPDSSTSFPTDYVRSQSTVTASAKAIGGRKFTVNVTVRLNGVANPSGQVYVNWVQLKQQGNNLVPTGKWISKLVTYTNGKASYTVKVSKTGYWAWEAYHPDTSTALSSSTDGYLKVR